MPASGIVLFRLGVIETDAELQREMLLSQRSDLSDTVEQRLGGVGQHQARIIIERIIENIHHIRNDERLAAGE